jgi:hypothetical protein
MAGNIAYTNRFIAEHDHEIGGFCCIRENVVFGALFILVASFLFAHYMQEPYLGFSVEPHVLQKEETCSRVHNQPCLCYYRVPLWGAGVIQRGDRGNHWTAYNLTRVHCRPQNFPPLSDFVEFLRYHFHLHEN